MFRIGCCLLLCLLPMSAPAQPDPNEGSPSSVRYFRIPVQPLTKALTLFSEQSGWAVLVDSGLTAGKTSAAVEGAMAPETALAALLQGSGLSVRYARDRSFTLVKAPRSANLQETAPSASGDVSMPGLGGNWFGAILQRELRDALCADALTRPGDFRTVMQLWISARGQVTRLRLLTSTGLPSRDKALTEAVRRMRLRSEPPPGLPQPITVLFLSEVNSGKECLDAGDKMREHFLLYYNVLLKKLKYRLGSDELAEDALHDAWLRINQLEQDKEVYNPSAYLYRTALNVAIDNTHQQGGRLLVASEIDELIQVTDATQDLERLADGQREIVRLRQVIAQLSWRQQEILIASRLEGKSHQEIANRFSISTRMVEKELKTALQFCAKKMQKEVVQRFGPKARKTSDK
ncbi:sigma-70 family RNA polymerase sigma factor [Brenneria izadpanahii]|uniref:Sigma-70 family RNA polymerase sigma factor n=1 Tax=Brenneria izadpanahii TaxID=2722756 RepID=A0ABX7USM0_9GAMM|nr:sigma-70 family RNA polymerase sigma factor [Brenneria izadpanahii]QTF08723.1 sigma-70 family RNA polymerase sigma factor [Brenneria izadpanahii]